MSKAMGMRCVRGLCGVLAGVFSFALTAQAEVTSDYSASVMVYPHVEYSSDGRDTVIQLANTSNNVVYAHCFYVDARESFGRPLWQVTDFRLILTKHQPTHWVASQGRRVDGTDSFTDDPVMDGAGLDPGAIPPVQDGFQGELKCVQTDAGGAPLGGNNLKGEAVLITDDGDPAKYNAWGITANPEFANGGDPFELMLGNTADNNDPATAEYNSCANMILIDHFADGAPSSTTNCVIDVCEIDPVCDAGGTCTCSDSGNACDSTADCEPIACPIRPYITVVPCQQDFENLQPERVTVQFAISNEFEQEFSTSTTVDCWLHARLADLQTGTGTCTTGGNSCASDDDCDPDTGDFCEKNSVFSYATLGSDTAFTQMTPVGLHGGVMAIGHEQHWADNGVDSAWTAWNLHQMGTRYDATVNEPGGPRIDRIRIPAPF